MSDSARNMDRIQQALANPTGGVLGLVDELLAMTAGGELTLERPEEGGVIVALSGSHHVPVPLAKSVLRAVLARIASLCRTPRDSGSSSPYQGQGIILIDGMQPRHVRVEFVNTPGEQRLKLTPIGVDESPRALGGLPGSSITRGGTR